MLPRLADGTYILRGGVFDHPLEERLRWLLVSESADRVSISIPDPKTPDGQWGRTFVFETPDLIREEGGMFHGSRLTRSQAPSPK